jgi:hypothetical protein
MSTAELIYEKAKALPDEALHYVDFLLARLDARAEDAKWAQFSSHQLKNNTRRQMQFTT